MPHTNPIGTADIKQGWNAMEPLPTKYKFRTKPRRGEKKTQKQPFIWFGWMANSILQKSFPN